MDGHLFFDKPSILISTMSENTTIIDVEKLISEISGLVSLPQIYLKIRELMDDPDSCLDDFVRVASTDPGLVAVVLKIVNSAFFGFKGQIDNLNRAINLIGIGQLHDLVLSLSAVNSLDLPNDIEKSTLFWQRSIYSGVYSRLLAKKHHLPNAESLFVIGLLHNIGRLILFLKYPEQSRLAIIHAQTNNISLTEAERTTFGTDYSQIGYALMAEWNLPVKFQHIIKHHTEPDKATEFQLETNIVHISHILSVNKFPFVDNFQHPLTPDALAQLKIREEELLLLSEHANEISLEMERLILG